MFRRVQPEDLAEAHRATVYIIETRKHPVATVHTLLQLPEPSSGHRKDLAAVVAHIPEALHGNGCLCTLGALFWASSCKWKPKHLDSHGVTHQLEAPLVNKMETCNFFPPQRSHAMCLNRSHKHHRTCSQPGLVRSATSPFRAGKRDATLQAEPPGSLEASLTGSPIKSATDANPHLLNTWAILG